MGGQSLCQLTYYDGLMYSGTWSGGSNGNSGKFYCYDTTKNGEQSGNVKKPKWISDDQNGYSWSGATIVGDAVIFGGDSGRLQSVSYTHLDVYKRQIIPCPIKKTHWNIWISRKDPPHQLTMPCL